MRQHGLTLGGEFVPLLLCNGI